MDNFLEKIVREKRSEELSKLNAIQIVNGLFSDLMEKMRILHLVWNYLFLYHE